MAHSQVDQELEMIKASLIQRPKFRAVMAILIRQAIDEVIDGGRTGRWSLDQLSKTEKAYIGTKIEILLKATLNLDDGAILDANINGVEVDVKTTIGRNWMIPSEARNHICILVKSDERRSKFSLGLIRAETRYLNKGKNKDSKRTVNKTGMARILWLLLDDALPVNMLAALSSDVREAIMAQPRGQKRLVELFRRVQRVLIPRTAIETLAQQKDAMKRTRKNGGARDDLAKSGIVLLGHWKKDHAIAVKHGLPKPRRGELLAFTNSALL